jgi:hypothetical protein
MYKITVEYIVEVDTVTFLSSLNNSILTRDIIACPIKKVDTFKIRFVY